ncbi:hypothetical protein B0H19DRAFT_1072916 [Mycena capillaripes]|nr:hypothetical protein B0H19DRAFT_1072916 [Mycena capillaripes]
MSRTEFPYHLAKSIYAHALGGARRRARLAKLERETVVEKTAFLSEVLVQQKRLTDIDKRIGDMQRTLQTLNPARQALQDMDEDAEDRMPKGQKSPTGNRGPPPQNTRDAMRAVPPHFCIPPAVPHAFNLAGMYPADVRNIGATGWTERMRKRTAIHLPLLPGSLLRPWTLDRSAAYLAGMATNG